jgi:hypothetical protein
MGASPSSNVVPMPCTFSDIGIINNFKPAVAESSESVFQLTVRGKLFNCRCIHAFQWPPQEGEWAYVAGYRIAESDVHVSTFLPI